mmetsp:Transcript_48795/g.140302  ORF Transcript_48795/g.140302 Transcript_48795/m.140302 type:complete len:264 (+) Transcript_48795:419-1210(+)
MVPEGQGRPHADVRLRVVVGIPKSRLLHAFSRRLYLGADFPSLRLDAYQRRLARLGRGHLRRCAAHSHHCRLPPSDRDAHALWADRGWGSLVGPGDRADADRQLPPPGAGVGLEHRRSGKPRRRRRLRRSHARGAHIAGHRRLWARWVDVAPRGSRARGQHRMPARGLQLAGRRLYNDSGRPSKRLEHRFHVAVRRRDEPARARPVWIGHAGRLSEHRRRHRLTERAALVWTARLTCFRSCRPWGTWVLLFSFVTHDHVGFTA